MGRAILLAVVVGSGGVAVGSWLRNRAAHARLWRRVAAHRDPTETATLRWWERSTARLSPLAGWLQEHVAALLGRLQRSGVLAAALEQARLAAAPAEVVTTGLVVGAAVGVAAVLLGVPVGGALLFAVLAGAVPYGAVAALAARRCRAFARDLPDVLALLAGTLRAGVPLTAALEAAATEASESIAPELRRVAGETALGRALPEAFDAVGVRMRSEEMCWVGMAVEIHQQAGGNLAEILDTVARTVAQRQRLRREVASLTAEGRISAVVLGVLPFGLAGVIAVVNPGYLATLLQTGAGTSLVVGAGIAMLGGFVWMRRIVNIEI